MKYLLIILGACILSAFAFLPTHQNPMEEKLIKEKVHQFAEAVELRDISSLENLLHKDFRVIANQYPTPDKLTLLDKPTYLMLMKGEKIGGEAYTVDFSHMSVVSHSATVICSFKGKDSAMELTLLFIKNNLGEWQIIEDMALLE